MHQETRPRAVGRGSVSVFRFDPRDRLDVHEHDSTKLIFVESGTFRGFGGGDEYSATRDEWILAPPGLHGGAVGAEGARAIVIEPDTPLGDRIAELTARVAVATSRRLRAIARVLSSEISRTDPSSDLLIESAVLDTVAQLMRLERNDRRWSTPQRWLERVRERLHEEAGPISIAELAASVGVSASHLNREFRRVYGRPIGGYARELRLTTAARHLVETRHSLSHIAQEAGFYDQSHFTNVFRKHFGTTPGRYRAARAVL